MAFPPMTSPLTASLSSRSSRVSASAMSVIAATVTSHAQVVGPCDGHDPSLPLLDEFTALLTQDDVRVLVDLLKLAVAERAGPSAKEVVSNVLIGNGHFLIF